MSDKNSWNKTSDRCEKRFEIDELLKKQFETDESNM